jgi:DNA polymerase-3 subunit delta
MAAMQHAFEFLAADEPSAPAGVCVLLGDEPFLKQLVRRKIRDRLFGEQDQDTPFATFEGKSASWRDVSDELRTVSLFGGGGRRLVVVDDADPFVTEHRVALEALAERSGLPGLLLLEVTTWPGNTRLAKIVAKHGLAIDCRAPQQVRGKSKTLDTGAVCNWIIQWGERQHAIRLQKKAAQVLLDLVSTEFGLLDQSLAKLALFVRPGGAVSAELVGDVVGGWKTKTTWDMMDAALDGDTAEALRQLDRLLMSGDPPQALFGQISWSLRRLAAATRVYERAQRSGRKLPLRSALEQAGVQAWQSQRVEKQLQRVGRKRAGKLYEWLLESDLALKGSHSTGDRARWVLERLLLRLAGPATPAR